METVAGTEPVNPTAEIGNSIVIATTSSATLPSSATKKPSQKRKKPAGSPHQPTPGATDTPGTKTKPPPIDLITTGPAMNGSEMQLPAGSAGTTSHDGPSPPSAKKQKKKQPEEGKESHGKKQKSNAKQARFHIKLYSAPKQPVAATTAGIAKKKQAKQQTVTTTAASEQTKKQQQQNGKKSSKKSRPSSKVNGASVGLAPSSVVTPLKRPSQIKQEPRTLTRAKNTATDGTAHHELDSVMIGRQTFAWLIGPGTTVDEFMRTYWERKHLLVKRNDRSYYGGLLSRAMIDEMLRTNNIEYTKNIDITSYRDGQRETHNPDGRVLPPDLWHFYDTGCSVRMLNPQTYLRSVYELNVKLQEYFHCMTGANFYLTPPGSQGFAPHYDDIEAFVLQIEGRKRWRLYGPRTPQEVLARVSSENLRQDELAGPPILDVVLEAGDLLYFPRGCIHQAATVPGAHSLHITVSMYQRNCWADLFEQMLPIALAGAAEEEPQLREGLPLDLHQHFGIVHSDGTGAERRRLIVRIRSMFDKLFSDAAIDGAVDQLAKRFQHDALPPLVDFGEWDDTVYGSGNYEFRPDGTVRCARPIDDRSSVRLLRRNILRLVSEEDKLRIYYHTDNSREYHQYEANFLELDHETALGVELLIKMYPRYVLVSSLPVEDRLEFIRSLWEKGLIVCRRPDDAASANSSATFTTTA
ncbi:bifunctional lysine-specific demethylase and histidyl-hydroxylase NO66 [Anopheles maculipalpis]|uniref:bifunctional lysine-specific demethylase and histidyl-hydroxylase NO66 n=1 Tax=Anopheles maculipalpis TaxID=1496333 RepID=UPI0021593167|nr:bifunctional lysine-specific demethylase and histidyl-hydroxylase NO66 [Anopheles maculipalpis]